MKVVYIIDTLGSSWVERLLQESARQSHDLAGGVRSVSYGLAPIARGSRL